MKIRGAQEGPISKSELKRSHVSPPLPLEESRLRTRHSAESRLETRWNPLRDWERFATRGINVWKVQCLVRPLTLK